MSTRLLYNIEKEKERKSTRRRRRIYSSPRVFLFNAQLLEGQCTAKGGGRGVSQWAGPGGSVVPWLGRIHSSRTNPHDPEVEVVGGWLSSYVGRILLNAPSAPLRICLSRSACYPFNLERETSCANPFHVTDVVLYAIDLLEPTYRCWIVTHRQTTFRRNPATSEGEKNQCLTGPAEN